MKKTYEKPELQVLGSVESLTEAFGPSLNVDTYTYNNIPQPGKGSIDGVVVPTHTSTRL